MSKGLMMTFLVQIVSVHVYAAPNLEFRGTLVEPPPCALNDNETITVDFGDRVGVKKVASGIYRQPIPLTLTCENNDLSGAWQLVLTVRGTPAFFDGDNATVVTAEQENLGVKLYAEGMPFSLETPLKVNVASLPKLEAVLVQASGAIPDEGGFSAQATIRAEYQ